MTLSQRLRHVYIQVVGLFFKRPSLRLTTAARGELLAEISRIHDFEPAATLLWTHVDTSRHPTDGPRWHIAFYNIATRPSGRVIKIDGIPFIFVQVNSAERLDRATLDFRDIRFVVEGDAPAL